MIKFLYSSLKTWVQVEKEFSKHSQLFAYLSGIVLDPEAVYLVTFDLSDANQKPFFCIVADFQEIQRVIFEKPNFKKLCVFECNSYEQAGKTMTDLSESYTNLTYEPEVKEIF